MEVICKLINENIRGKIVSIVFNTWKCDSKFDIHKAWLDSIRLPNGFQMASRLQSRLEFQIEAQFHNHAPTLYLNHYSRTVSGGRRKKSFMSFKASDSEREKKKITGNLGNSIYKIEFKFTTISLQVLSPPHLPVLLFPVQVTTNPFGCRYSFCLDRLECK